MASEAPTVIHRFVELALGAETAHNVAVDCAGDTFTYIQLLTLASNLAHEVIPSAPENPVVAIISENHPYTLALILATWLAGGAVASLDVHAPEILLRGMLQAVKPNLVVFPDNAELTHKVCQGAYFLSYLLGYRCSLHVKT